MGPDDDPHVNLSYIYDNRRRIKSRIAQLNSGVRHSQTPPSVMRRMLANLEVLDRTSDDQGTTVAVGANFALYEYRYDLNIWAGRVIYRVRKRPDGELRLVAKTVHLVNAKAAQQSRGKKSRQTERNLKRNERAGQSHSFAGGGPRVRLQSVIQPGTRRFDRRCESEEDRGKNGDCRCVAQNAKIHVDVVSGA